MAREISRSQVPPRDKSLPGKYRLADCLRIFSHSETKGVSSRIEENSSKKGKDNVVLGLLHLREDSSRAEREILYRLRETILIAKRYLL